jgi:hypothetical protein
MGLNRVGGAEAAAPVDLVAGFAEIEGAGKLEELVLAGTSLPSPSTRESARFNGSTIQTSLYTGRPQLYTPETER